MSILLRAIPVFFLAISLAVADTLHILPLRNRPANEIEPLVRPMLRADEGLTGNGYQLILRATESRRDEIARIVAALDVAQKQLTITVRQGAVGDENRSGDSVSGSVDVGSHSRVIVGNPRDTDRRGDSLTYRGERRTTTSDSMRMQTVRVQDGSRAFIRIGQSIPIAERVVMLTGRGAVVATQGIQMRDFTSGFDVLPRVRGDRVQLEITPRLSAPQDVNGTFRFQELQTTVTARLGEWIDIGEIVSQSSDVSRAILESTSSQSGERISFSLKVE